MNRLIPKIGAAIVTLTVFLFSVFMIVEFPFGSYLVCMFLTIGYIIMAAGFHYESAVESKSDKWLKYLMMIHGIFFISCFIMPMTGVFTNMANGDNGNAGTIALLFWCAYFIPIGILSYRHFGKEKGMRYN